MLLHHKKVYLEAHESYVKGSYRNKSKIVTANGVQTLSVPLQKGKHQQKNIRAVAIAEGDKWRVQHWRSLKTAYQSAPYWDDYAMEIKPLCHYETELLWDYNMHWLSGIIEILGLNIQLGETANYLHTDTDKADLRQIILPKLKTWSSTKVKAVPYEQVFADRQSFTENACILDLLFCKGPETALILEDMIA